MTLICDGCFDTRVRLFLLFYTRNEIHDLFVKKVDDKIKDKLFYRRHAQKFQNSLCSTFLFLKSKDFCVIMYFSSEVYICINKIGTFILAGIHRHFENILAKLYNANMFFQILK